jgi:hypothetical protein
MSGHHLVEHHPHAENVGSNAWRASARPARPFSSKAAKLPCRRLPPADVGIMMSDKMGLITFRCRNGRRDRPGMRDEICGRGSDPHFCSSALHRVDGVDPRAAAVHGPARPSTSRLFAMTPSPTQRSIPLSPRYRGASRRRGPRENHGRSEPCYGLPTPSRAPPDTSDPRNGIRPGVQLLRFVPMRWPATPKSMLTRAGTEKTASAVTNCRSAG